MKNKFLLFSLALSFIFVVSSCEKEAPEIINPEELITTVSLVLTPNSGGSPLTFTFQDLDGDGGDTPNITVDTLAANTQYTGAITLLNEQENPVGNITEEVANEDEEHQLFFEVLNGLDLVTTYEDTDSGGNPVGLLLTINAGAASNGKLRITLVHEPVKDAAGVSDGDITNAGGEIDIEVEFDVEIQ